jgi:hypothetical protein
MNRSNLGSATLFFLHGVGLAAWFVPLSPVLEAHGLGALRPYAFATSAVAALVTPLIVGSVADRHVSPARVLRWLAAASAVLAAVASHAIGERWSAAAVLTLIQLHALVTTPTWSLLTSIALAGMTDARREFGPVRSLGTFGWVGGCLLVSALGADSRPLAGYTAAVFLVLVAWCTRLLPPTAPPGGGGPLTLRQRLGLDALGLLVKREHRVVFVAAALLSAPLAAFYPFTPAHLRDLGFTRISAWMSLAQATEVFAMFGLAALLGRCRTRWVLLGGLVAAALRYVLMASGWPGAVLAGISLHGFAFTLFFVTAPIYLNERIDVAWRARAQALLSLMTQGLGNLAGYLATGAWLASCTVGGTTRWPLYWGGLALCVVGVLVYFLVASRDRPRNAP